jgi:long-chain fatty acid transport protein
MKKHGNFFHLLGSYLSLLSGLLLSTYAAPPSATASGFAIYTHGAAELGMQNLVVAHTEGPASNYFNPALLAELEGIQIALGTTIIWPSREFKSAQTGQTEKTESQAFYPSTLFVSYPVSESITAGLGIVSPFGLGTDWGKTWEGRYITTNVQMDTFNINPNMTVKLTDKLAVSGGLDCMLGDATLENNVNTSLLATTPLSFSVTLPDGEQQFEGHGEGYGYNLGIVFQPTEDWAVGASYRSEIRLKLYGKAKFRLPQTGDPVLDTALQTYLPNADGDTTIELPPQLFVGACYTGFDKVTLEIGGRWEGWSSYDHLTLHFDQPVAESRTSKEKKHWKDVYSAGIGVKYQVNDTWAVLAGYYYEENPVPDDTFEPAIPSADKHDVSFGVKKTIGNFTAAVSYLYENYERRSKNNAVGETSGATANGTYHLEVHAIAASVSYRF